MLRLSLAISILLLSLTSTVHAGQMSTNADGPGKYELEDIASFAKMVEKSLASKGARVAIVSRVGRSTDELPKGVYFTHVAFWVYSSIQTADGRTIPGYHIFSLYQRNDELNVSDLVNDYPVDYFWGVQELKAGIIIPKPKLQKAIIEVIYSDSYKKLHNPKYSVVASPFNNQYQNCTELTLDVVLSALYETDNMDQLKVNANEYFTPTKIQLSPLKSFLGALFVDDFTSSDHKDGIETATFTSIRKFMQKYELTQKAYSIKY
jgi:hypothetical protein